MNCAKGQNMKKIKDFFKKLNECTPKPAKVLFVLALISLILKIAFSLSPVFSDFYNRYPGAFFRMINAKLTGWFPFSLAETILMLMPLIVTVLVVMIIKVSKKTLRVMVKMMMSLLAALAFFFTSFTFTFAAGYSGTSLDEKLGISRQKVSADELYDTAKILLDGISEVSGQIEFRYGSSSVMPYTLDEMNRLLQDAYIEASKDYSFLPAFRTRVKYVVMSEPMTYTHISGVYTYFTGESNINTNFPDYTLPYTAAHELAHQRGISKEDEANFVAFLVCLKSDDPYIRYSGFMSVYEYVISALYRADKDKYTALLSETDSRLRYEMIAYNDFFEKYRDNVAADISGTINDTYLASQGQKEGSRSYGMVVDLAVAYYKGK